MPSQALLSRVDHLVFAARDLSEGVSEIERLLGVTATVGGRHPKWGTRNALAALVALQDTWRLSPLITTIRQSMAYAHLDWTILIARAWLDGPPTPMTYKRFVPPQLGAAYRLATFFPAAVNDPTVQYFSGS